MVAALEMVAAILTMVAIATLTFSRIFRHRIPEEERTRVAVTAGLSTVFLLAVVAVFTLAYIAASLPPD